MSKVLLEVKNLKKYFQTPKGQLHAVDNVNFAIEEGKTLGVVAQVCDKVAIMYAGEIVEYGTLEDVFENPKHPYTLGLFGSIPSLDEEKTRLVPIKGLMPDPTNLPSGCKFNPRCPHAVELCSQRTPVVTEVSKGHKVQCLIAEGLVKFRENWEEENE